MESGFKQFRIGMPDSRLRVDGSRIRKEKVADSKIFRYGLMVSETKREIRHFGLFNEIVLGTVIILKFGLFIIL